MKTWNFKVEREPNVISNKLKSKFETANGFMFKLNSDNSDSLTFKLRKRFPHAWGMIFLNYVIVKGEILKKDVGNETNLEVSFSRHILMKLTIFTYLLLGLGSLFLIISGISNSYLTYTIAGLLIALGIILWLEEKKGYTKKVNEFKSLILDLLK